jgi:hypothetical protein
MEDENERNEFVLAWEVFFIFRISLVPDEKRGVLEGAASTCNLTLS